MALIRQDSFQFSFICVDLGKFSGHGGGHSCKTKYARKIFPRYNAPDHLPIPNHTLDRFLVFSSTSKLLTLVHINTPLCLNVKYVIGYVVSYSGNHANKSCTVLIHEISADANKVGAKMDKM